MSRTGPGYVESESELFADLELKQKEGEISEATADAFIDLYEFAKETGDRVTIGQAKNANFQMKVNAHQGDYQGDPGVFTANVDGDLKIWPARMPLDHDDGLQSISWDPEDYEVFAREFKSLQGNPHRENSVDFEQVAAKMDIDGFKSLVDEFVCTCREKAVLSN